MLAILCLLLGCLPPLVAGPLAGIAYLRILKRGKMATLIPFWAVLVLLNLLVMFWVASSTGKWLPIASLSAFFVTPVAAILTVFVMRITWRRLEANKEVDVAYKGWFKLGLVLIPALQLGMFVAFILYGPWLCKVGLLICRGL